MKAVTERSILMSEIIAYLDDNREWEKSDIPANLLTCINYAFAKIEGVQVIGHLKKIQIINTLKKEHPHLKTCISIGGWGADGFSEAVSSEEKREEFITSIISYIKTYDFDGIDLDWEYPGKDIAAIKSSSEDSKNFLYFVEELRQRLDQETSFNNKKYLLTAAIGASRELLDTMSVDHQFQYIEYLDYVNVMTYDMRGSFTKMPGHHTNLLSYENEELSADQAVQYLLKKGISSQKIVIGGAWYARKWIGIPDKTIHPMQKKASEFGTKTMDYSKLKKLLLTHPENIYWDNQAKAPYYYDGEQFLSYDNIQSVQEKANYIKENNLRGFMYWEHSLDLSNELVKAAAQVLH